MQEALWTTVTSAIHPCAGMYGQSTVRQVELATGNVLRSKALGPQDFGEGITRFGDKCAPSSTSKLRPVQFCAGHPRACY